MTKIRFALGAIIATAMAGSVQADDDPGFYVSGFLGLGAPGDAGLSGVQNPEPGAPGVAGAPANIGVEYDSDLNFGVAIGYDTGWEFFDLFQTRLELEYSRIDADVDSGSFNDGNQPFSGDTSIDFFLLNNYTDIVWRDDQTIIPYIGGGIGVGIVDANILYAGGGATSPNFAATGDDSGLAGTIAGGVTFETADQWDLYGEARYYQIRDIELERRFIAGGADLLNAKVEDDFDGFTFSVGVRRKF
ncbi:MAG: outer membrane beta-barrel protein [Pseudomonadota bacterium]